MSLKKKEKKGQDGDKKTSPMHRRSTIKENNVKDTDEVSIISNLDSNNSFIVQNLTKRKKKNKRKMHKIVKDIKKSFKYKYDEIATETKIDQ